MGASPLKPGAPGTQETQDLLQGQRPIDRDDFEVAIICALPLEARTVAALFEKEYDAMIYGKAIGDPNTYSFGLIGPHNVVLVHMPTMGKVAAATAASNLHASFQRIKLAMMVGICAGAPFGPTRGKEVLLGDVVISEGLVQYDFGRRFPNNKFVRKDTPRGTLPSPNSELLAVLAKLQAEEESELQTTIAAALDIVQRAPDLSAAYPGRIHDRLFESAYFHKHRNLEDCATCGSGKEEDMCFQSFEMSCDTLGCDERELVSRAHSIEDRLPVVHFGLVASGDTVMRSGLDRDEIATRDGVIAFEMEGVGMWEAFPGSCLVIKSVCDYADSHKNKKWQGYAAATAAAAAKMVLAHFQPATPLLRTWPSPDATWTATDIGILNRLKKTPYQEHKDRNPDRIPGTCEWFIEHKLFRGWLETRSEALWVSADPGCGKSVLAKHLVDSALPSNNHRTTCYFFFKDDSDEQRSIVTALCCILYQLFLQKRKLFTKTVLVQLGAERETLTSSFSELWSVLLRAAEDDNSGEIVCVLDAIDECDASGSSLLTQALSRLYRNSSNRKPKLKFFITSRPTTTIRRGLLEDIPELPVVHLSGESEDEMEKIAKEIDIFVETRVRTLSAHLMLSQDEQELLLRELLRVPNRTYLYVHLTLNLIEHEEDIDEDGILKATSQLPKTVDDAYDRILSHSRNPDQARKILHIVVAAVRPLTLSEMGFALALHESHRSYGELNVKSEGRLRESIRDTCGLFVTIINSRIYLLHQTAKEYLVQHDLEEAISDVDGDVQWKHSLQPQDSHRILAEICTWNLLFDEFETDPLTDTPEFSGYEASRFLGYLVPEYLGKHVFLGYSATQWATHMRESPAEFASSAAQSIVGICDTGSSRFSTWFQIYWVLTNPTRICPRFSNLMAVSYFGLATAVKSSLKTGDSKLMNRKDRDYGRTALSWAAGNGHESAIQLFAKNERKGMGGLVKSWKRLKVGLGGQSHAALEVDLADVDARTPLTYAIWSGNEETVKLLLSLGARATEKDKLGATPVDYAVAMHQVTLAELMLGNEAKSGSTGESNTLLLSALENGDQHVVRLLLESGTDIDSKTSKGQTLLSYAAALGKLGVVRLLIKNGADINLADWVGRTPLSIAAGRGRVAVVESLLENEADIDLADANGRSPLFYAAKNFHCLLVGLDDADLAVDSSENPSLNALKLGDITRVLLENGANISLASSNGRTPMSFFAKIGYYALANILVNVDHILDEEVNGAPPYCTKSDCSTFMKFLLENDVDFALGDPSSHGKLLHAAGDILRFITGSSPEGHADINLEDHKSCTALIRAVGQGHYGLTKLLLDHGANVNHIRSNGRGAANPLLFDAISSLYWDIFELLLQAGADTNAVNWMGQTPLSVAAQLGHLEAVRLLLATGPDVNLADREGMSPLSYAVRNGHVAIARLLRENRAVGAGGDEVEGGELGDEGFDEEILGEQFEDSEDGDHGPRHA